MGLFEKLSHEFIDIIDWTDSTNNTIVWKFPRYQNEIKMGAQLTVRESQQAVFLNEGRVADVFRPGMYTLRTENLPLLTILKSWKYGFDSPFKADVFFVSTKQFIDQKWGTRNPITLNDDRFGLIEIRAFGTFAFRIKDAGQFIKEIAGTDEQYTTEEILNQLRSLVVTKFTDAAGEGNFPIEKFAANLEELSAFAKDKLNTEFADFGIEVTKFALENVSMPDELKKEIFEYSRLNKIDMQKYAQLRAAKSIEKAVENENGIAGLGASLGVGLNLGSVMGNTFGNQVNQQQTNLTPPPITQYYTAVNGQQSGPFSIEQITKMIQEGSVKRDTLAWKTGMGDWAKASVIDSLSQAFSSVPPPPPPVG